MGIVIIITSSTPNCPSSYVKPGDSLFLQAFRFMSHKFHGRGSGKKKIEKRLKKIQDEEVRISLLYPNLPTRLF